jgi:polysaccharide biosynthesis transport protein
LDKSYAAGFDFRYILQTIKRRWYVVVLMIILSIAFAYYKGYHRTTITYQAKIGFIVGNPIGSDISQVQILERYIQTYCALAKTSFIAERVSAKLNKGIPAEAIQASIMATPQTNTQFVNAVFTWKSPTESVEILNIFSEVFINEAKSIYPTCSIQVIENIKEPKSIIMSKKKYFILAVVAGLIFSILVIFSIELFDNTIKTEEDVKEYLNGSVIGEIPKEKNMINNINSTSLNNTSHIMLEAFRTLRTNVEFVTSCNNLKAIVVTSARPGEGKTSIAAILATVISQTGKRTILIDCDLRNPNIHKIFTVSNEIGLTNYLAGKAVLAEATNKSSLENLFILTSGIKPPNPAELLSSAHMKSLMRVLRNDYDYIIIDTPPVGLVTDAQILSQLADGSIFVVSSGKSVRVDTIKSKELIRQVSGNIVGFVLNNVKYSSAYKKYSYYYERNSKTKLAKLKKG